MVTNYYLTTTGIVYQFLHPKQIQEFGQKIIHHNSYQMCLISTKILHFSGEISQILTICLKGGFTNFEKFNIFIMIVYIWVA